MRDRRVRKAILVIVGLFVLYAIVGPKSTPTTTAVATTAPAAAATSGAPATSSAPTAPPTTTPTPAPTPFNFGSGTKAVGTDIPAGTYRTRTQSGNCYWARLSGFGGQLAEILANDNTSSPAIVTIEPTDKGFQSTGCSAWTADLSPITTSKEAPFADGMYQVGVDIAPGTWRNAQAAGTSCYWARLSGFNGTLGQVLANDNTTSSAIVTIAATDKAFKAMRCGTWTKI